MTKREWKYFTIAEVEKEQEYLREMHSHGWKLTKVIFPGLYYFEECQPEDVVYQLDYNTDGEKHKTEYVRLFQDCGWEYVLTFVGYHYFRKPVTDMQEKDEEIFNDEDSKLEMQKRVWKGRIVPLVILFFVLIVPQLVLQFFRWRESGELSIFVLYAGITVMYLVIFISQYNIYRALKTLRR